MKSVKTDKFKKAFDGLPLKIQQQARDAYELWKDDSTYPNLHFKQIHRKKAIYSVRIGLSYRALGVMENETIIWFWIGSHEEYNKLISQF